MGDLTENRCALARAVLLGKLTKHKATKLMRFRHHSQVDIVIVAYVRMLIAQGKITSDQLQ